MDPSALAQEEAVLARLEQLDALFASIKDNLRVIKTKAGKMAAASHRFRYGAEPWLRLFGVSEEGKDGPARPCTCASTEVTAESVIRAENSPQLETPVQTHLKAPNNDASAASANLSCNLELQTSTDLITRSFLKEYELSDSLASPARQTNSSPAREPLAGAAEPEVDLQRPAEAAPPLLAATQDSSEDDTPGPLLPFDEAELPELFKGEEDLRTLYNAIQRAGKLRMDEAAATLPGISEEKIRIFVALLCRKRFIGRKGKFLFCE